MTARLKPHEQAKVPVYSRNGKIVAFVNKGCTSVGAAKAAHAPAAEWTFRFKTAGWVIKGA